MNHSTNSFLVVALWAGVEGGLASGLTASAQEPPDHELRPLVTRYAKTATKASVTAEFKAFQDVQMQEADQFDGYSTSVDVAIPFAQRFQVRLYAPIYTSGDARALKESGRDIDIWGFSGIGDFANAQLDYQLLRQPADGVNLSISGGAGMPLTYLNTSLVDRYNHVGRVVIGGLKLDKKLNDTVTLLANAGARYYWVSDDVNPSGGDDTFALADLSAAGVFNVFNNTVYPVVELIYEGDFGNYNSLLLAPEVIWPLCENFELKAGVTIGLTGDGESLGARFQAVVRF